MILTVSASSYGKRLEIITGLIGLIVLFLGVAWVFQGAHIASKSEYPIRAIFTHADGLDVGSDVRVGGVKVGTVSSVSIDPKTWQAVATFEVSNKIKLPIDSSAAVTSDSLLGGKYISLTPGGDEQMLGPDALMSDTQGSISLEALLSKFIFSVSDSLHRACIQPEAQTK